MAVISCHLIVEILPDPFDAIFIGAVRRQELKRNVAQVVGQCGVDDLAAVDAVVVQNYVDPFCIRIFSFYFLQQFQEQIAVFPFAFDHNQFAVFSIECSGEVSLFVLARCKYFFLCPAIHPVQTDFRVQMDIDFIFVNENFARFEPFLRTLELLILRVFAHFDHGQPTVGRGRPRRALIVFRARLMVAG